MLAESPTALMVTRPFAVLHSALAGAITHSVPHSLYAFATQHKHRPHLSILAVVALLLLILPPPIPLCDRHSQRPTPNATPLGKNSLKPLSITAFSLFPDGQLIPDRCHLIWYST